MWDKILTDEDGPYIELMVGAYSDNQPDYSWLQPYEVKSFSMYWYPFREIGGVKKANLDAAVNLEVHQSYGAYWHDTTAYRPNARMLFQAGGKHLFERAESITPDKPFGDRGIACGTKVEDLKLPVLTGTRDLISYQPAAKTNSPMPAPVTPPAEPSAIKTTKAGFAGQRLEQFHSPARDPEPYYLEALKQDASDYRANTALGLREYRRGLFAEAGKRFEIAVARAFRNYTRPRDGEAYYYLGLADRAQGKDTEARDAFIAPVGAMPGPPRVTTRSRKWNAAERTTPRRWRMWNGRWRTTQESTKGLALKAAILRHLERTADAVGAVEAAMRRYFASIRGCGASCGSLAAARAKRSKPGSTPTTIFSPTSRWRSTTATRDWTRMPWPPCAT